MSQPRTLVFDVISANSKLLYYLTSLGVDLSASAVKFLWSYKKPGTLVLLTTGAIIFLGEAYEGAKDFVVSQFVSRDNDPKLYAELETKFGKIYYSSDSDNNYLSQLISYLPNLNIKLDNFNLSTKSDSTEKISFTPNLNFDTVGYITDYFFNKDVTKESTESEEIINLFSNNYVSNQKNMSIVKGSVGVNIPQVVVACVEDIAISKGSMKNALVAGLSVGVSNLVPAYTSTGMWGSGAEKYLVEPLVAGIIYSIGSKYMKSAEKEGSMLKRFSKGFVIGASSAAISGAIMSTTIATARVPSQYSTTSGLRQNAGNANAKVPTSMPNIVVA